MGSFPYIRVGGSSQDWTRFDPKQTEAYKHDDVNVGEWKYIIGPKFFDALKTIPTKVSHGFNLISMFDDDYPTREMARWSLRNMTMAACEVLDESNTASIEIGNEPDLYPNQHRVDHIPDWSPSKYASFWNQAADMINKNCPKFGTTIKFQAPSIAGSGNRNFFSSALKLDYIGEIGVH